VHLCERKVWNYELIPKANDRWSTAFLEGLLGPEVRVVASPFQEPSEGVSIAERALVDGVVRKRQLEFLTGRALARSLLMELGFPDTEILRDPDRVPIWPAGIVGSISHSVTGRVPRSEAEDHLNPNWRESSLCVVAVARTRDRLGIGIDVEPDQPVRPGLAKEICDVTEMTWVEARGDSEAGRRCRIVFSIKEAVYKAFFPRVRTVWGFNAVHTEIDLARDSFCATLPPGAGRPEVEGRVLRREGWIISGVEYS
jgi:4'-phosphopantetheinyl transferase EntD